MARDRLDTWGAGSMLGRGALRTLAAIAFTAVVFDASADTLETALVQAYQNNPQLNAQRALVRATDENVPQALSGYRPKISATASYGAQYTDSKTRVPPTPPATTTRVVETNNWVDP